MLEKSDTVLALHSVSFDIVCFSFKAISPSTIWTHRLFRLVTAAAITAGLCLAHQLPMGEHNLVRSKIPVDHCATVHTSSCLRFVANKERLYVQTTRSKVILLEPAFVLTDSEKSVGVCQMGLPSIKTPNDSRKKYKDWPEVVTRSHV